MKGSCALSCLLELCLMMRMSKDWRKLSISCVPRVTVELPRIVGTACQPTSNCPWIISFFASSIQEILLRFQRPSKDAFRWGNKPSRQQFFSRIGQCEENSCKEPLYLPHLWQRVHKEMVFHWSCQCAQQNQGTHLSQVLKALHILVGCHKTFT